MPLRFEGNQVGRCQPVSASTKGPHDVDRRASRPPGLTDIVLELTHATRGPALRLSYGNKELPFGLGARYGPMGWYAPPGVDLMAFRQGGWLRAGQVFNPEDSGPGPGAGGLS